MPLHAAQSQFRCTHLHGYESVARRLADLRTLWNLTYNPVDKPEHGFRIKSQCDDCHTFHTLMHQARSNLEPGHCHGGGGGGGGVLELLGEDDDLRAKNCRRGLGQD